MCEPLLEAHDGSMFINYEIARALVSEHQSTLRHEAQQHRLGRRPRKSRRHVVKADCAAG